MQTVESTGPLAYDVLRTLFYRIKRSRYLKQTLQHKNDLALTDLVIEENLSATGNDY